MSEEIKKDPEQEEESLLNKAKKMADKAEDFIEDTAEKVKGSIIFKKAGEFFDKAEDFVEDKTEDLIEKAKIAGKNIAEKADDLADNIAEKVKGMGKDDVTPPKEPKA